MYRNHKLTAKKKDELKQRDGHRCRYCGSGNPLFLEIDHIKPKSKGGSDREDNLTSSCKLCNALKGSLSQKSFKEYLNTLIKLKRMRKLTPSITVKFIVNA